MLRFFSHSLSNYIIPTHRSQSQVSKLTRFTCQTHTVDFQYLNTYWRNHRYRVKLSNRNHLIIKFLSKTTIEIFANNDLFFLRVTTLSTKYARYDRKYEEKYWNMKSKFTDFLHQYAHFSITRSHVLINQRRLIVFFSRVGSAIV